MDKEYIDTSTGIGRKNSLRWLLESQAQQYEDKPFIIFLDRDMNEEVLTYRQFDNTVNRLSNWLLSKGISKGDAILCHLPNSIGFVAAIHACTKIGAVPIPSIISDIADDLAYKINFSESKMVVTDGEYFHEFEKILDHCPSVETVVICRSAARIPGTVELSDILNESSPEAPAWVEINPLEDPAAMLFTSGTTARPKAVVLTHGNFLYTGGTMARYVSMRPDDRAMVVLPLFHVNALCLSWFPVLEAGASVVICEKFDAEKYVELAHRYQVTYSALVGAAIKAILAQDNHPLDSELKIWRCAYAIKVTEEEWVTYEKRFNTTLIDGYGLTETAGGCIMGRLWRKNPKAAVGIPFFGIEVAIVDNDRQPVPTGEVGEIAVKGQRGLTLFKEYYNNPKATNEAFTENWFFTGDMGRIDEEGSVYFVDRKKDMIKRSGENIAAAEVERVLKEHPAIEDVALIGLPDPKRDEVTMAVVRAMQGEDATEEDIKDWCKGRMAKFKIPDHVYFMEKDFPMTSVGKIRKNILKAKILERNWNDKN